MQLLQKWIRRPEQTFLSPEAYLSSLSPEATQRVINFKAFLELLKMDPSFQNIDIGLLAVGSSTKTPKSRSHKVQDIDLRVLNSAARNSDERNLTVANLRTAIRNYLDFNGMKYIENDCTIYTSSNGIVESSDGTTRDDLFLTWYNSDPSFYVKRENAELPLHISISGLDNPALEEYLAIDRKAVVLLNIPDN